MRWLGCLFQNARTPKRVLGQTKNEFRKWIRQQYVETKMSFLSYDLYYVPY